MVAIVEGYDPKSSLAEVVLSIIHAGASQILGLPIEARDFRAALERIAGQYVYSVRDKHVIAVAGANGGSGATTVALNLAYEIANRHELRCVLVDLSLHLGGIASHLGVEPDYSIIDLVRDTRRVDSVLVKKVLIKVTENLQILAGPSQLLANVAASPHDIAVIIETLTQIADVVVLDVSCNYDDIYFEVLSSAGQTVLIGEQKLSSIRALKMVREAINHDSDTEHLVFNRFNPSNKEFTVERMLRPLGVSTLSTVACDEVGVTRALNASCTLRLASPRSPALADIVALADKVLKLDGATRQEPAGLFQRLSRRFANA
jgi:pilus assembly protein CpaE